MTKSCNSHIIIPLEILLSKIVITCKTAHDSAKQDLYYTSIRNVLKEYVLTWENGSLGEESRKQN